MVLQTITAPYLGIYTKCFLCKDKEYNVFIDSGLSANADLLTPILTNGRTNILLMTHGHWDHIGCNSLIKNNDGHIYAHPADSRMYEDHVWHWRLLFGQFEKDFDLPDTRKKAFWESIGESVGLDTAIQDGDILEFGSMSFRVIGIPGHSGGSVCYYEESSGVLFSGDGLIQDGFFGGTAQIERYDDYINSMEKLAEVGPKLVLTDHTEKMPGNRLRLAARTSIECAHRYLNAVERYANTTSSPSVSGAASAIAKAENKHVGGGTCVSALGALCSLGFTPEDYVTGD
jgi:glyoxylase-like metal-dependent hydrolase (beta-lactamase superfamily II)